MNKVKHVTWKLKQEKYTKETPRKTVQGHCCYSFAYSNQSLKLLEVDNIWIRSRISRISKALELEYQEYQKKEVVCNANGFSAEASNINSLSSATSSSLEKPWQWGVYSFPSSHVVVVVVVVVLKDQYWRRKTEKINDCLVEVRSRFNWIDCCANVIYQGAISMWGLSLSALAYHN